MKDFYHSAGLRIRSLREINHLTREEFSEIVDLSPKFLYEIETGQKGFSADTLFRISKGLGVSAEYILSGDKYENLTVELHKIINDLDSEHIEALNRLFKALYTIKLANI